MLSASEIRRAYPNLEVLKGINLEIGEGEIVSVVGASGAGKTTLLQILGTLDHASSGSLKFNGENIGGSYVERRIHASGWKRLINYLIDWTLTIAFVNVILISIYDFPYDYLTLGQSYSQFALVYFGAVVLGLLLIYFLPERLFGRTLGKMITGTKVVTKAGDKPKTGALLLRTFCRMVPFEQFSFLATKPQNGFHDGISDTIVVNDRPRREYGTYSYEELGDDGLSKFRNREIGFVFQFHHLLPEFTAIENVVMPALIAGKTQEEANKRAVELLSYLGLADRTEHKPAELSGGEQQRVAVARALINEPALVFADEPSGNLDSKSARELHNLFFDLRDRFKQTFVIVTHNEELANLADRKLTIVDGVISTDERLNTPQPA